MPPKRPGDPASMPSLKRQQRPVPTPGATRDLFCLPCARALAAGTGSTCRHQTGPGVARSYPKCYECFSHTQICEPLPIAARPATVAMVTAFLQHKADMANQEASVKEDTFTAARILFHVAMGEDTLEDTVEVAVGVHWDNAVVLDALTSIERHLRNGVELLSQLLAQGRAPASEDENEDEDE